MLETGMAALLLTQSSITALIGNNVDPIPAPEDLEDYPCITYQEASYTADYTSDGASGWAQKRLVYNCWGTSWMQAKQIQEALRVVLTGYRGTLSEGTQVFLIEVANGEDFFESASRLWRSSLHALIQYSE